MNLASSASMPAVCLDVAADRQRQRAATDDARAWRTEPGDAGNGGFGPSHLRASHPNQTRMPYPSWRLVNRAQLGELRLRRHHYVLAARLCDGKSRAKGVEALTPLDAKASLPGSQWIVKAGVNDPEVS